MNDSKAPNFLNVTSSGMRIVSRVLKLQLPINRPCTIGIAQAVKLYREFENIRGVNIVYRNTKNEPLHPQPSIRQLERWSFEVDRNEAKQVISTERYDELQQEYHELQWHNAKAVEPTVESNVKEVFNENSETVTDTNADSSPPTQDAIDVNSEPEVKHVDLSDDKPEDVVSSNPTEDSEKARRLELLAMLGSDFKKEELEAMTNSELEELAKTE